MTSRIATMTALIGFTIPVTIPFMLLLEEAPGTVKTAIFIEIFYIVFGMVIPITVILRNENMKQYAKSLAWFCHGGFKTSTPSKSNQVEPC